MAKKTGFVVKLVSREPNAYLLILDSGGRALVFKSEDATVFWSWSQAKKGIEMIEEITTHWVTKIERCSQ